MDAIIINNIDTNNCTILNLDTTANIIKHITPYRKSPMALVDIAEVATFRRVFLGVIKYLSKFPVLI